MIAKKNLFRHASKLFSMRNIGVLFLLFAMVCGIATFVENAYGTEIAKSAVYDSKWFEVILFCAIIALGYNIIAFKLFARNKFPVGLFHLAFIIIILGAGITRYTGKEGKMHIRQGEKVNYYAQQSKDGWLKTTLPFALELRDFEIDYYPGSKNPSEYRSCLSLWEKQQKIMDFDIYMNHILKRKGYRFYQSSYDHDYCGTILLVNHDPFGIGVTYIGYFMLFAGLCLSLFVKGSRFRSLLKKLQQYQTALCVLCFLTLPMLSKAVPIVDKSAAKTFGNLWVSNGKGRILPMNTLNLNLLKKISHESSYQNHSADEIILSIFLYREEWKNVPIICIDDNIARMLNISSSSAAYTCFFKDNGEYLLMDELQTALSKAAGERTKKDKSLINITERISIFNMITEGSFMDIYHYKNNWFSPYALPRDVVPEILKSNNKLLTALRDKDEQKIEDALLNLVDLQKTYGADIVPSETHKRLELTYNRFNLFSKLAPYYATLAILLLIFSVIAIIKQKQNKALSFFRVLLYAGFVLQSVGILIRWYISGRAPMGNGYESMLMVSWLGMAAGLFFAKKAPVMLAISSILAAATLLVAHINAMNPEITMLVPVLDSYWLSFHVATITASYALLGSCALLGLFNVSLQAFTRQRQLQHAILELTTISQLLMIVGLYLLTIGCFIGAIWANESWGRYWSWDPKETWCLISIVIYAFILHMHHIPKLKSSIAYNIASIWAIASILMTYFGVNYFLGGMHSYAGGKAPNIPSWTYFIIVPLFFICSMAVYKKNDFLKK